MNQTQMKTIPLKQVQIITDDFWKSKIDLAKDVIISYQWDVMPKLHSYLMCSLGIIN
ncbi:hypothetical protein [Gracilibacillus kekensis]|uniref:Uncharacterized protein n=1 Tax=Gracilibacillus kekensis TaxID=1027249 RepID=A0A1M7MK19_9BACI|nr:hypothetical protein [Gracilibacillus kekensis]SHM90795.1 hypothetical protein SAMN05216179_1236 [Gracilibacillus kekensis]